MQITTKWLTPAEVERTRASSITTAQTMVQSALPDWPQGRTDALLDASMTLWGKVRLSQQTRLLEPLS